MRTLALATFALLCLTQIGYGGQSRPYSEVIAFCDSLSDVGNVAGITEEGTSPLIDGYYEETHFSDNIIWIEWLADYRACRRRRPAAAIRRAWNRNPMARAGRGAGPRRARAASSPRAPPSPCRT